MTTIEELKNFLIDYFKNRDVKIYLFGSRARGDFRKYSDIDILIESDNDLKDDLIKLKEIIEESNLIYKVDLIEAKRVNLKKGKIIRWL